jgi:hypothetical protein
LERVNRELSVMKAAIAWWRARLAGRQPDHRHRAAAAPPDRTRALSREQIAALFTVKAPLRERTLWKALYETCARTEEILCLGHRSACHLAVPMLDGATLAHGLSDSPAGLLTWLLERWNAWSDNGGDVESVFTKDDLLTHATIYWVNNSIATSMRYYANASRYPWAPPTTAPRSCRPRSAHLRHLREPARHPHRQRARPGIQDRPASRLVQPRQRQRPRPWRPLHPLGEPNAWVSDLRRTFHGRRP